MHVSKHTTIIILRTSSLYNIVKIATFFSVRVRVRVRVG